MLIISFFFVQGLKWRKHYPFNTFSSSYVFETTQNILFTFFDIFGLILCYFWRQNSLKTWILAFWTTLVNACWPHVCDMTKYILGACKYLSQVPSPQISCLEMQNSSWGVEKTIFFCLHPVDGIITFFSFWKGFLLHRKLKIRISFKERFYFWTEDMTSIFLFDLKFVKKYFGGRRGIWCRVGGRRGIWCKKLQYSSISVLQLQNLH